jgi:ComEC/Rec2-related protein
MPLKLINKPNIFWLVLVLVITIWVAISAPHFQNYKKTVQKYESPFLYVFCSPNSLQQNFNPKVSCNDIANLASGLLVGKGEFSKDFKSQVNNLGLTHIIVASGTQVVYLFTMIEFLLNTIRISKKRRVWIQILCGIALAVFCGFSAPIVRALITVGLSLLVTVYLGRYLNPIRALGYAYVFMLLVRPDWFYSYSFWLSFIASFGLATAGLLWPKLESTFTRNIITNIWITILLLPILLQFQESFNFLGLLLNITLIPFLPFLLVILLVCLFVNGSFWSKELVDVIINTIVAVLNELQSLTSGFLTVKIEKFTTQNLFYFYFICILLILTLWYKENYSKTLSNQDFVV